ncbi:MAG TPA: DMT family transporter [Roseomonas sp.]|jgi:drug/metabolite transporter (DMT)-like permease
MTRPGGHAAGILLMLAGVLLFSLNDTLGKWLVATFSVGQVLVLRSLAALALLSPFLVRDGLVRLLEVPRPRLQLLRVAFGTAEVASFYWAVSMMPLADAMTYWMAAPVFVTLISAAVLREKVEAKRFAAVALGFAGVLLAMGPGLGARPLPVLIALVGALFYALFVVCTRSLRAARDTQLVAFQMGGGLLLGLVLLPFGWVPPGLLDVALLFGLGIAATLAHVAVTRSLRLAPASIVVPWQYSFILWAALFGWLAFGDVPGPGVAVGAAVIVLAGFWLWRLESRSA